MRLGGTEVIVANYQDFVDISRYWQRDPNIIICTNIWVKNPELLWP